MLQMGIIFFTTTGKKKKKKFPKCASFFMVNEERELFGYLYHFIFCLLMYTIIK